MFIACAFEKEIGRNNAIIDFFFSFKWLLTSQKMIMGQKPQTIDNYSK